MEKQTVAASSNRHDCVPLYVVFDGEMMIDAPVKYVWRHAINYASWQNYSVNKHVSGPRGGEGEVVMLQKNEAVATSVTPFFARTIKLDPERRVIWKTYMENVDYFGIVEFRMSEIESKTRFCINLFYEWWLPREQEAELETLREQRLGVSKSIFATAYPRLKQLAESDAKATLAAAR